VIRFAWLQFRMQAALAAGALVIGAIVLAATGPSLVHLYDTTVANCASQHDCSAATTAFTDTDGPLQVFFDFLVLLAPLLIGIFWGAPLVSREFETGTFRLVWTQGVSRTRWLAVKLGLGALVSMAAVGLLTFMVSWWSSQLDQVSADPFNPLDYSVRDLVPIGYAAFTLVLGAAAGLIFRRMLPAILTVLVGFAAVREGVTRWIRPYLFAPVHKSLPITAATPLSFQSTPTGMTVFERTNGVSIRNAWLSSIKIVDNTGHMPTTSLLSRACPQGNYGPLNPAGCNAKLAAKFHQLVTYQPANRYWPMQWYELAIFLGLAIVLAGVCFYWIGRPLSRSARSGPVSDPGDRAPLAAVPSHPR
jgi:ABC-type transport system involved in multi-copper enzyme maturation permease subunit